MNDSRAAGLAGVQYRWSGESISYHLIAELENYIVSCELSLTFSK